MKDMSEKVEDLRDHRRKKKPRTMKEAAQAAAQHIRNIEADKLNEPEGFASGGDMRKIIEQADDEGENREDNK